MTINLLKGMGKAYKTYLRNKASKKLFNNLSENQKEKISQVLKNTRVIEKTGT